ncbi:hypothetical protein FQA39_LY10526 [Lamprigera yunnana]|nr:hypothetical protein FQA39_LY10526 [Lamprigera yunnana]
MPICENNVLIRDRDREREREREKEREWLVIGLSVQGLVPLPGGTQMGRYSIEGIVLTVIHPESDKTLNNRDHEIIEELKQKNIDICAIQETKKNGESEKDYGEYFLVYSGVEKQIRAKFGVGVQLNNKYKGEKKLEVLSINCPNIGLLEQLRNLLSKLSLTEDERYDNYNV